MTKKGKLIPSKDYFEFTDFLVKVINTIVIVSNKVKKQENKDSKNLL